MKREGPSLESLMDWLAAAHNDFINAEGGRHGGTGELHIPALINDLLVDTGESPLQPEELAKAEKLRSGKNLQQLAALLCHLYHNDWFLQNSVLPGLIRGLLFSARLALLAESADNAQQFITDPDRREELCRIALDAAGLVPAGEDEKTAAERLAGLDSIERKKILDKTAAAQKRAREIREAMLRKEAEEAASKMSRE